MKRIFSVLSLCLLAASAAAVSQNSYIVTVTNTAITSNSITAGGRTRIFTNATTSTTILTNLAGPKQTTTNLHTALGNYLQSQFSFTWLTATQLTLRGPDLTVSVSGGGQPNWGYVTTNLGGGTNITFIGGPPTFPANTNQTNFSAWITDYLNIPSGHYVETNAAAFSNYVSIGISVGGGTQTVYAPKFFYNLQGTNGGFITGGTIRNAGLTNSSLHATGGLSSDLILLRPLLTNGVNYGNAFRSPGSGANSEQFGTSAEATGASSLAIGNGAKATNSYATAIGDGAQAWAPSATAVGKSASARGDNAIALGIGALAGTNCIAIGFSPEVTHDKAVVIAPYAANSLETNDTLIANNTVTLQGRLQVLGTQTNTTFTGTNQWKGDMATPVYSVSTLANGNNQGVDFGTNYFIRLAPGAVSAANAIVGIADGRDGLEYLVFNDQGYSCSLAVNTVDPVPANRFDTYSGADIVIINQGWAVIKYEPNAARWTVANLFPSVAATTNAVLTSLAVGPSAAVLTNILSATAALDFPNTTAATFSDLGVTVTGATTNDTACIGVPFQSMMDNSSYSHFMSNNVVWIRFVNSGAVAAQNPAVGTFRVTVFKHQ